jgi:hypothetical protein
VTGRALVLRLFDRKSEPEQLLESAKGSLAALRRGLKDGKVVKASLIAGGVAALTAGSAGISALRRRLEGDKW